MPMAPLNTYQNAVVDRYKSADGTTDYEKAWSYLDRIMGREIGKAGGLLTFNAILIAVAIATGPWWSVICPVVASLVLLLLLGVCRGAPSDMTTARDDLMAASRSVWQGMSLIDISIVISAIGILVLGIQRLV
ncbi:MAG: hypothetical protein JO058_06495 [Alphaproteobacteria bacterium]|nr:hypothetical protein [Alphaproteobacteria bacterium]MBV9151986.1 hypothetical protein [Alphaproteobacteria bacterium]